MGAISDFHYQLECPHLPNLIISDLIAMIKAFAKQTLSAFGYTLMREHPGFRPEWVPIHDKRINLLEILIKLELFSRETFKFVQIGANDGVQADPLSVIIRKYRLKGIMIEPIPKIFARLESNYADVDGLDFQNLAITVSGDYGQVPFYTLQSVDKQVDHRLSGFATTSKEKIYAAQKLTPNATEVATIEVDYQSVAYFVKANQLRELSLLVTDVEGLDIDLVSEFIRLGVLPNIIYMEILDQSPARQQQIMEILISSGYVIGGNISDLIAYKSDRL